MKTLPRFSLVSLLFIKYLILEFIFNIINNTVTDSLLIRLDKVYQDSATGNHFLSNIEVKLKFIHWSSSYKSPIIRKLSMIVIWDIFQNSPILCSPSNAGQQ